MSAGKSILRLFHAVTERERGPEDFVDLIETFQELCRLPAEQRAILHLAIADRDPRLAIRLADLLEAAGGAIEAWRGDPASTTELQRGILRARSVARKPRG